MCLKSIHLVVADLVQTSMDWAAQAIVCYLRAKDSHRPYWMDKAFTRDAQLKIVVQTDAITFPAACDGRESITDTLVRRFGQTYDNVYTFCLCEAPKSTFTDFRCRWLVVMTQKDSGTVRVGCGDYDWRFDSNLRLANHLTITIDAMELIDPSHVGTIMDWASGLSYPWCASKKIYENVPDVAQLKLILQQALAS